MSTTMKDQNRRALRRPALDRRAAMTLAADEYTRFADTVAGPAGGEWGAGTGGEAIEMDAVQFCRVLSGRGEGSGLLATEVPF